MTTMRKTTTTVAMIAAVAASIAMAPTSQAALALQRRPRRPLPRASRQAALGKTVFLDPGHQGSAAGHDLNKPVPDGRGGTKPCQTSGATGVSRVPEHTVNWQVAQLVRVRWRAKGRRWSSVGPTTPVGAGASTSAAAANRSGAALAVSIHADSSSRGRIRARADST